MIVEEAIDLLANISPKEKIQKLRGQISQKYNEIEKLNHLIQEIQSNCEHSWKRYNVAGGWTFECSKCGKLR